jgi:RNA polymerase sigma-70 factor, ECF subfamily
MILRQEFPGANAIGTWHGAGSRPRYFPRPGFVQWKAPKVIDWPGCISAIAHQRDRAQFQILFGHFAPRLKSFFIRSGATPGVAEDLAQETLLMVWRKAALFEPGRAQASTWIFTIARNLRIDAIRRERDPQGVAEFFDRAADPSPSEHLLSAERDALVRRVLKQLSPEQAEVIRLSFYEDRPHSEIATLLGLPLGTVKSRVRLAMARLRILVEDKQ